MRRGPFTGTLLSCLNFTQHLIDVTSFRLSELLYSGSILFKHTNNFGSVFPNLLDHRIYKTKLPTHISFLFSIFYLLYDFNVSFNAQKLPLIRDYSQVIMLPVSLISGFRRDVDVICSLLGDYTASCNHPKDYRLPVSC
jgi:hypothetical protein